MPVVWSSIDTFYFLNVKISRQNYIVNYLIDRIMMIFTCKGLKRRKLLRPTADDFYLELDQKMQRLMLLYVCTVIHRYIITSLHT